MVDGMPPLTPSDDERRRYARKSVLLRARFHRGRQTVDCLITNISASGARVRVEQPLDAGGAGTLENERFGMIPGEVVWLDDDHAGLRFLERPQWIARLLATSIALNPVHVTA